MITTIDGVCGMTAKKSASIDSLTSSIQCASSITYSAGRVRANDAAFTSAVNRRRRASGSIVGSGSLGVGDAQQVIKQQQILLVGVGDTFAHARPRAFIVETH